MSLQHGIVKQPSGDLSAFDVSKQSPAEIAQLFVLWKERRKRLNQPQVPARPARPTPLPAIARSGKEITAIEPEEKPAGPESAGAAASIRYSDSFAAVLATRDAPTLTQKVWNADTHLAVTGHPHPPRRRSKAKWLLAGAASLLAVTASGAVLWRNTPWNESQPAEAAAAQAVALAQAPGATTPTQPWEGDIASKLLPKAVSEPKKALIAAQGVLDRALLSYVPPTLAVARQPIAPRLKPHIPIVTASKPAAKPAVPVATAHPLEAAPVASPVSTLPIEPFEPAAQPFTPTAWGESVAVPPEPPAKTAQQLPPTPRPPALLQHGNDREIATNKSKAVAGKSGGVATGAGAGNAGGSAGGSTGSGTSNDGGAASGGSDAGAGGSASSGDPGGGAAGGGSGDGSAGGAGGGDGGSGGSSAGGGGDAGGGASGGGNSGGGDAGSGAGSGDAGGAGDGASGGDGSQGGGDQGGDNQGGNGNGQDKDKKDKAD